MGLVDRDRKQKDSERTDYHLGWQVAIGSGHPQVKKRLVVEFRRVAGPGRPTC
jgi:hypothetical protein